MLARAGMVVGTGDTANSTPTHRPNVIDASERAYLRRARVARLATADIDGRPNVVPICFALVDDTLVSAVDEKPKDGDPSALRRLRDVAENPRVALVVDHYRTDWSALGWVQIRGTATRCDPGASGHDAAVEALRSKYDQYADHDLASRPILRIDPGSVVTWGTIDPDELA